METGQKQQSNKKFTTNRDYPNGGIELKTREKGT